MEVEFQRKKVEASVKRVVREVQEVCDRARAERWAGTTAGGHGALHIHVKPSGGSCVLPLAMPLVGVGVEECPCAGGNCMWWSIKCVHSLPDAL